MTRSQIEKQLVNDRDPSGFVPILGGGVHSLVPGQVTDDTELGLALARALVCDQWYDENTVAKNYLDWFHSRPFDIRATTRRAFGDGAQDYFQIVERSKLHNADSSSNGCLMRTSPLGIFGTRLPKYKLMELAERECAMTNPNSIAVDAVRTYINAICAAIKGETRQAIYRGMTETASTDTIKQILLFGKNQAEPALVSNEGGQGSFVMSDSSAMGYLGIALQQLVYELLCGPSFYSSIVRVVERGGDTDTNACIVGSLLGAFYGIESIPESWKKTVLRANPDQRLQHYPKGSTRDLLGLAYSLVRQ
jgi:ADP-ribosylglycohydrolase